MMKTIFISSTFRDMHYERDVINKQVEPELNDHARSYGETVLLKDLRWGISTEGLKESQAEIKVLKSCLEEIDHSRPYMVILLGDRYGTIFEKEQIRQAIQGYQGFSEEDLTKSIMGLEIKYGALNRECWKDGEKPKALFYFRSLEGDFPEEYQGKEGTKEQELLKNLKDQIIKEFGPEQVHEYCLRFENKKPNKESLEAFAQRVRKDIQDLFQTEWKEKAKWSETKRELDRHWDYARQKGEQFRGREDLLIYCCEKLEEGRSVFAIKGASGTGKSTLLGKLAVELAQKGNTVVPLFCGTTDRMSTTSDVMIFLIDYIAEHLGLSMWKQSMEENNPTSKQFGLSMQMEELEEFSEKQLFEKELASKTDNISLLQEVFREYILRYNEEAQSSTVILVDAIDQLAKDELRDKLSFLPNLLLYGNREKEEKKGSQAIDVEEALCFSKETPSTQRPKLQMVFSFLEEENYRLITPPPSLKVIEIGTLEKEEEKRAVLEGIFGYYHKEAFE